MFTIDQSLIFGNGYIGQRLSKAFQLPISQQRITQYKDIQNEIDKYKPRVLINCIGHTGEKNVDDCERAIDNTLNANSFIPFLMAEAAFRNNIKLVHLSSGCIYHYDYESQEAIKESLTPDYYTLFYSRSKIYSEVALTEMSKKTNILIPRIRIPLDDIPHPRNILNKLIRYKTVIDIPNSVSYLPDFLSALKHLITKDAKGVYNIACKEPLRYPELLDEYRKHIPNFKYSVIPMESLNLDRTNLILSTQKLEESGFKVRSMETVIQECIHNYIQNS